MQTWTYRKKNIRFLCYYSVINLLYLSFWNKRGFDMFDKISPDKKGTPIWPYCAFGFYLKDDTSAVIRAADNLLPNGIGENNGPSSSLRTGVFFRIIDRHVDSVDMSKTRTVSGFGGNDRRDFRFDCEWRRKIIRASRSWYWRYDTVRDLTSLNGYEWYCHWLDGTIMRSET